MKEELATISGELVEIIVRLGTVTAKLEKLARSLALAKAVAKDH